VESFVGQDKKEEKIVARKKSIWVLFGILLISAWVLGSVSQTEAETLATAQPKSLLIEDLTWTELRDAIVAGKTTAIYYAGSTEQNGPGLVLGKHNFLAHYIAQRIAEELGNALVYPIMPYAPNGDPIKKTTMNMRFPGTVDIPPEVFGAVARGVALSAMAAGFKNMVLMGDHGGGQQALKKVAEELNAEWSLKGFHVYYIPDLYFKEKEQMREYLTKHQIPYDEHAGTDDTAEVMFIDHDNRWVRKDKLALDDGKTGVIGDPTKATKELGKMFIDLKINNAVTQIRSLVGEGK